MREGFKVLRRHSGKLVSSWATGRWCRVYREGERTYPIAGSKLFFFRFYEGARDWKRAHKGEIWKVLVPDDSSPIYKVGKTANSLQYEWSDFWAGVLPDDIYYYDPAPLYTWSARWIMPYELIE